MTDVPQFHKPEFDMAIQNLRHGGEYLLGAEKQGYFIFVGRNNNQAYRAAELPKNTTCIHFNPRLLVPIGQPYSGEHCTIQIYGDGKMTVTPIKRHESGVASAEITVSGNVFVGSAPVVTIRGLDGSIANLTFYVRDGKLIMSTMFGSGEES